MVTIFESLAEVESEFLSATKEALASTPSASRLLKKVAQGDQTAISELTAIHMLNLFRPAVDVEVEPPVTVEGRNAIPDFRIRLGSDNWTYVEVTQLNNSKASDETERAISGIAETVVAIEKPFMLEVVFWRDPADDEERENLVIQAIKACEVASGSRLDVGNLASILVKSGDTSVVTPSIISDDNVPRMCTARAIAGPGAPNRQMIVRAPFADQRASHVLTTESGQLPKEESCLIIVDARRQSSAFESWAELLPECFTTDLYTHVGGVLLFATSMMANTGQWAFHSVRLISNPHAMIPVPHWISEGVSELRLQIRRGLGLAE